MSTVVGKVISVSLEADVKKQAGGTYKAWELVYKTDDGEVRTIAKPVTGLNFGPGPAIKATLETLEVGDEFTLEQEKKGAFNEVQSITKGRKEGIVVAESKTTNTYTPRPKDTYETAEERAIKQRLIVRQSSLTTAHQILTPLSKAPTVEAVLALAEQLTDWVYEKGAVGIANMNSDIPD